MTGYPGFASISSLEGTQLCDHFGGNPVGTHVAAEFHRADAIGFDAEGEVFGARNPVEPAVLNDLDLGELGWGQVAGDELVTAVEEDGFEAGVASALGEAFDFGFGREEWCCNLLAYCQVSVYVCHCALIEKTTL